MVREGEIASNRAIRLRLFPTEKQKSKILHNIEVGRFVYNYIRRKHLTEYEELNKAQEEYKQSLPEKMSEAEAKAMVDKFRSEQFKNYVHSPVVFSSLFTAEIKQNPEKYDWFGDYDSNVRCATIFDSYKNAYNRFIDGLKSGKGKEIASARRKKLKKKHSDRTIKFPQDFGFPSYKQKSECKSYPTVVFRHQLDVETHKVYLPKIGWVRFTHNQDIPDFLYPSVKLAKCTVSTDGHDFYFSFAFYKEFEQLPLSDSKSPIIGIDLGLHNLAILSDGSTISNIADDPKVIKLNNKIKKLQRKLCWLREHSEVAWKRKQEVSKKEWAKEKWKINTRQMRTIQKRITKAYIALNNYKDNRLHEQCSNLVKRNPEGIVFENLNIDGMRKNKRLAPKIQQTGMYKFKATIMWYAKKYGITVKEVERRYASSQTCSNCNERDESMKDLSKRTFVCPHCGMVMDRDVNAAINLKKQWDKPETKVIVSAENA